MKKLMIFVLILLLPNLVSASLLLYDALDSDAEGMKDTGTFIAAGSSKSYEYANHFNPNEGTIQFWIKPEFDTNSDFGMFEIGDLGYANSFGIVNIFTWGRRITFLEIRNNNMGYLQAWHDLDSARINKKEWAFVTAVWKCNSGNNDFFQLFINGVPGHRHGGNLCENFLDSNKIRLGQTRWYSYMSAIYDELKIFDNAKTHEEIIRDYRSYLPIKCYANSDCGNDSWTGEQACYNNEIKQNFATFTCKNPATLDAYCENSSSLKLKQTCSYGCANGNCLKPEKTVEWLKSHQFSSGLVESQIGWPEHRSFSYDQALAIITFTNSNNMKEAKKVLNTMKTIQNKDGSWYSAYYSDTKKPWEWIKSTGNVAWMVIAINFYEAKTNDKTYSPVAEKAIEWLKKRIKNDSSHSCYKGLDLGQDWWNVPNPGEVFSAEHNLDSISAINNRAKLANIQKKRDEYKSIASNISDFIKEKIWNGNAFYVGCNNQEFWLDPQTMGYFVLGNDYAKGIDYADANMKNTLLWNSESINGYQYNDYNKNSIWVEGTAQIADAFAIYGNDAKAQYYLNEINKVASEDGGIPYSFNGVGGKIDWPDNLRYPSVSSVAWTYFAKNKINPLMPNIAEVPLKCEDSDYLNYYNKGNVKYYSGGKYKTYEDYCSNKGKNLVEYYCTDRGGLAKKSVKCSCANGACGVQASSKAVAHQVIADEIVIEE